MNDIYPKLNELFLTDLTTNIQSLLEVSLIKTFPLLKTRPVVRVTVLKMLGKFTLRKNIRIYQSMIFFLKLENIANVKKHYTNKHVLTHIELIFKKKK